MGTGAARQPMFFHRAQSTEEEGITGNGAIQEPAGGDVCDASSNRDGRRWIQLTKHAQIGSPTLASCTVHAADVGLNLPMGLVVTGLPFGARASLVP
jgi:hypothetical protein